MKKVMMLGAAILALQALPALAQEAPPAPAKEMGKEHHRGGPGKFFEKLDADKDGSVTEQEFIDAHKAKFAEMDGDKDGKVTKAEIEARRDAMKKKWEAKKAEQNSEKPAEAPVEKPKAE